MADTSSIKAARDSFFGTTEATDMEEEDKLEFVAIDCKVETVVVYLDRAEVCRSLKAKVKEGENEILLKKLSASIDQDSIRVEGRGPATITEVAFQSKHLMPDEEKQQSEKEKELRQKIQEAENKRTKLYTKQHRLRKQRDVLDGFADNVMKAGTSVGKGSDNGKAMLDSSVLAGMTGFFDLYDNQAFRLDERLQELEEEIRTIQDQVYALEKNLQKLVGPDEDTETRDLSILLDATEGGEVELYVSYVVSQAKWTPKYDIRVFSGDNTMKILYYGLIQQHSGEDWEDARLCLSTATPSVGGVVPELGTHKLNFKPKPLHEMYRRKGIGKKGRSYSFQHFSGDADMYMPRKDYIMRAKPIDDNCSESLEYSRDMAPIMESVAMEVKESIASTMYEIARRSTIPSDDTSHKVSVAIIDLKPTFEYECVPKKASHAFLKAKVRNSSPYALLSGPTSIFLDNNFVAKSELKAVSPSEEFTCSLGVDPAVRVDYKPIHKYREHSGLISKVNSLTYRQVIEIKNTHKDMIRMLVTDQLPLSTEEKIKVTLQEPSLKDKSRNFKINKYNNIEWDLEIGTNETRELTLKYTVEYPASEDIESSYTQTSHSSEC